MKLIASKDIRNVPALRLKEEKDGKMVTTVEGAIHDDHIHKGAFFSIGPDNLKLRGESKEGGKVIADITRLQKIDPQAAYNIALLDHAGCIADATDEKAVAKIKAEIEEDKKREANARKLDQAAQAQGVLAQLLQAVKTLKPAA